MLKYLKIKFLLMTVAVLGANSITAQTPSYSFKWFASHLVKPESAMRAYIPGVTNTTTAPTICRGTVDNSVFLGVVSSNKNCIGRSQERDSLTFTFPIVESPLYELLESSNSVGTVTVDAIFGAYVRSNGRSLDTNFLAGRDDLNVPWINTATRWFSVKGVGSLISNNDQTQYTNSILRSVASFDRDNVQPVCSFFRGSQTYVGFTHPAHSSVCVAISASRQEAFGTSNFYILRNSAHSGRSKWYYDITGVNYRQFASSVMESVRVDNVTNVIPTNLDRIPCRAVQLSQKLYLSQLTKSIVEVGGVGFLSLDGKSCITQGILDNRITLLEEGSFEVFIANETLKLTGFLSGNIVPLGTIDAALGEESSVPLCYGMTNAGQVTGIVRGDGKCHALTTDGANIVVTTDFRFITTDDVYSTGPRKLLTALRVQRPNQIPTPVMNVVTANSRELDVCQQTSGDASTSTGDSSVEVTLGGSLPLGSGQVFTVCNNAAAGFSGNGSLDINQGGEAAVAAEAILRNQFNLSGKQEVAFGVETAQSVEVESQLGGAANGGVAGCWTSNCGGIKFEGGVVAGADLTIRGGGNVGGGGSSVGGGGGLSAPGSVGGAYSGTGQYRDGIVTLGAGITGKIGIGGFELNFELAINTNQVANGAVQLKNGTVFVAYKLADGGKTYIAYAVKNGAIVAGRQVSEATMRAADATAQGFVYANSQILSQGEKAVIIVGSKLEDASIKVANGIVLVGHEVEGFASKISNSIKGDLYPAAAKVAEGFKDGTTIVVYSVGKAAELGSIRLQRGISVVTKDVSKTLLTGGKWVDNAALNSFNQLRRAGSYVSGKIDDAGRTMTAALKNATEAVWGGIKKGWNSLKRFLSL
jgi:hypothetical protein